MGHFSVSPIVASIVDAIPWPAFLVDQNEQVVFANEAARACGKTLDQWTGNGSRGQRESHVIRRRQVQMSSETWWLLLIENQSVNTPEPAIRLSPRMRQLADLLANACSDKEISQAMGLTLASTRTYVRELYRRLSVHSRAELTRVWMLANASTSDGREAAPSVLLKVV